MRGSRERFVRAATVLGVLGIAFLAPIPAFGTRNRHHSIGECSYEVVSRAPTWMWLAGVVSLALANSALVHARGVRVHDTRANGVRAWVLGLTLLVAVVWFAWVQWGYHEVSCQYYQPGHESALSQVQRPSTSRVDTRAQYQELDEVAKDRAVA